jgi:hypothetical protein
MSTRILEFSPHGLSLSGKHLQKFSEEKNLGWEVEHYPAYDETLLEGAKGALVEFNVSEQMLSGISTLPTMVRDLECFDCMIPQNDDWYPRVLWFEALRDLIVETARDLDNRSCGFVIGANECSRIAAAVMAHLGFPEVFLISETSVMPMRQLESLRRKFIGVKFHGIAASAMTLQSVQGSLLVNCVDLQSNKELEEDLSYFNFMKRDGLVLDLHLSSRDSVLIEESRRAQLRAVVPQDFFLKRNLAFLQTLGLAGEFKTEDFAQSWAAFLKSDP